MKLLTNFSSLFTQTFACFAVKKKFKFLRPILITTFTILFFNSAFTQNVTLPETIQNIAEELAADETDPEAVTIFIERLQELAENPVRINSVDENEISRLFFLSDFQIKTLMNHFRSSGSIVSFYEIATIPGFDKAITSIMIPFITLVRVDNLSSDSIKLRNNLLINLSAKPGETDTSSPGNQIKFLTKYKISAGKFSAGFTSEKDAGEKLFTGTPPLPDFLSGYISYSGRGIIKKIIAGDFSVRFGQGTNINTGMRTRLPLTSAGYLPGRDEIRPYTSTDENNFFRGAAGTFSFDKLELSMFFSHNRRDATLEYSADSSEMFIKNLFTSGLHNTTSALEKKDVLISTNYGINMSLNFKYLKIGITESVSRFGIPFKSSIQNSEDLYSFSGKKNSIYTLYYISQFSRFLVYGELSSNNGRNHAVIQGTTLRPSDRLSINFLYRNYSPGFVTFYGRGPGYGTSTCNEFGFLGNFTFEAAKHLFLVAGADICRFPWLKYRNSSPSFAKRYEVKLNYLPEEVIAFDVSYNYRVSGYDSPSESGIPSTDESLTHSYKGTVRYSPVKSFTLLSRIDFKVSKPGSDRGMLIMQDFIYRFRKLPVTLWFRYCIYNTDSWNSRLYIYENDLLYSFSIPALSGDGTRSYIMARWEIGESAELRIKYGITSAYTDNGSAEDNDELKLQFRIWF